MTLETRLANALIEAHPERAAAVLERLAPDESAELLRKASIDEAVAVLVRLSPSLATAALEVQSDERVARLIEGLPVDVATRLLRRQDGERVRAVLAELPRRAARGIASLLEFPERSAGASMDPHVLALPQDLAAAEALERVRAAPEQTHYNVYVVDAEQRLVGVMNLRELFLADPGARLSELMVREPVAIDAAADRAAVVSHRGWKEAHSLPVVDEQRRYLGALRYRTLRTMEQELLGGARGDADVRYALGQLFAAGAGAVFEALTAPSVEREEG